MCVEYSKCHLVPQTGRTLEGVNRLPAQFYRKHLIIDTHVKVRWAFQFLEDMNRCLRLFGMKQSTCGFEGAQREPEYDRSNRHT